MFQMRKIKRDSLQFPQSFIFHLSKLSEYKQNDFEGAVNATINKK